MRSWPGWLHAELMNWSRWCWSGSYPHPLPARHCASLEGDYQTPTYNGAEVDPRPIPPNVTYALIVDRVWRRLPDDQRLALRAEYPQRSESGRVESTALAAKSVGQTRREYEDNVFAAVEKVWRAFEQINRDRL